jgi:hypothetical protein
MGTENHDLEGGGFLLDSSHPSLPPGETGVLLNQESPLKMRSISATTPQQPPPISFLSSTDKLSTGSVHTDLFLGASSEGGSVDFDKSNHETSAEDVFEKRGRDVNSEKIVTDVLDSMRMALVDRVMDEFWVMFNQGWSSNFAQHAGNSSGTSRSSNPDETNDVTDPRQPSRRKRQRDDEGRETRMMIEILGHLERDHQAAKTPKKVSSSLAHSGSTIHASTIFICTGLAPYRTGIRLLD